MSLAVPGPDAASGDAGGALGVSSRWWRWSLPGGILVAQFLVLSVWIDLPDRGPALAVAEGLRLAFPVIFGALVGGALLARRGAPRAALPPLPAWRPGPALAVELGAFAATAAVAAATLGAGAGDGGAGATPGAVALVAGGGLAMAAAAARAAAPFGWFARVVRTHWRLEVLAVLVGGLAWAMALAAERSWGLLSTITLEGAGLLLRCTGARPYVSVAESAIGLGAFEVGVDPVCSGVDGVGLVVLFQSVWLATARDRVRLERAFWLVPGGALAALAGNALRIAGLVLLGASGREELALGGFHSKAGWVLFLAIALGGVALAERWPWLRREARQAEEAVPAAAAAWLAPLLAALAAAQLTGLVRAGAVDLAYGARVLAGLAALWLVRRELPAARFVASPAAAAIGLAVGLGWILWPGAGDPAPVAGALAALPPAGRAAWIAARLLGGVLLIPVVEELAFRGFLLPWLVSSDFARVPPRAWTALAVAGSSAAFGALHGQWLAGTLAGLAFAAAKLRRGRLGDAVLAHAVANAVLAAAALWGGRLDLWGG